MAGSPNTLEDLADYSTCMQLQSARSLGQGKWITVTQSLLCSSIFPFYIAIHGPMGLQWVMYCKTDTMYFKHPPPQITHFHTSFNQDLKIFLIVSCVQAMRFQIHL